MASTNRKKSQRINFSLGSDTAEVFRKIQELQEAFKNAGLGDFGMIVSSSLFSQAELHPHDMLELKGPVSVWLRRMP